MIRWPDLINQLIDELEDHLTDFFAGGLVVYGAIKCELSITVFLSRGFDRLPNRKHNRADAIYFLS
jgi:hypothetical protein